MEGVLSIHIRTPFDGAAYAGLRRNCELAALALAGLRERAETLREIAAASREVENPLAAARGFVRLAQEDGRGAPSGYQSVFLTEALWNINRLSESIVGLQHAMCKL